MENTEPLKEDLLAVSGQFAQTLGETGFYIGLLLVGVSLALGWLIALLARRRIEKYISQHPPHRIDPLFLTAPLVLLAPLLALLYLAVLGPVGASYGGGDVMAAAARLTVAYLAARTALLVVQSKMIGWLIAAIVMGMAVLRETGLLHPLTAYLQSLEFELGPLKLSMLNLINGIVILILVFWVAGAAARTLERQLRRSTALSYNTRELIVKFSRVFIYFLALMIALSAAGVDLTAFAVFGGALGVGLGLGLQKITANFVSGITLLLEKSIKLGDLIAVGDAEGWVRQLNVRYTLVETFDGRELMIPNEELTSSRVTNWTYTNDRARVEVKVGVAYGTDPARVKEILLAAAKAHPRCLKDPEPACWLTEFGDSSLNFLLVFWVGDVKEGRFGPKSDVMMEILKEFDAAGIEVPYPQRVVHMRETG